jgi:hypothetical protein
MEYTNYIPLGEHEHALEYMQANIPLFASCRTFVEMLHTAVQVRRFLVCVPLLLNLLKLHPEIAPDDVEKELRRFYVIWHSTTSYELCRSSDELSTLPLESILAALQKEYPDAIRINELPLFLFGEEKSKSFYSRPHYTLFRPGVQDPSILKYVVGVSTKCSREIASPDFESGCHNVSENYERLRFAGFNAAPTAK